MIRDEDTDPPAAGLDDVLRRFSSDSNSVIKCGPGWYPLVAACDRELAALAPAYQVEQVKEKYGELRYYVDLPLTPLPCCEQFRREHPEPTPQSFECRQWQILWAAHLRDPDHVSADARRLKEHNRHLLAMEEVIDRYERKAVRTCERCGSPGQLMPDSGGWFKTLCGQCAGDTYAPQSEG